MGEYILLLLLTTVVPLAALAGLVAATVWLVRSRTRRSESRSSSRP